MRYFCWYCSKSVTSELPDDSIIRAQLICPECIEGIGEDLCVAIEIRLDVDKVADMRTPFETGMCCMAKHANATPPWTCDCPCHKREKDAENHRD